MNQCCVPQCIGYADRTYEFPEDAEVRSAWINAIKSGHTNCKHSNWQHEPLSRICIYHFKKTDFRTLTLGDTETRTHQLKRDAVPSKKIVCRAIRNRKILRKSFEGFDYLLDDPIPISPPESAEEFVFESDDNIVAINTQLKMEVNNLTAEHVKFKEKLAIAVLDKQHITTSSSMCELTGVATDHVFHLVLSHVKLILEPLELINISEETQLMMVLIKLRMGIPDMLMSIVYSLSVTKLHQLYKVWLNALATTLVPMIKFENLKDAHPNYPGSIYFAEYINVTINKMPSSRPSRSHWNTTVKNEYENTNMKVLCILRPSGVVVHVSDNLPMNTTLMAALQKDPSLVHSLSNKDKIFVMSSNQLVTKKDIELGVVLDADISDPKPLLPSEFQPVMVKIEHTFKKIKDYLLLSCGLEEPFTALSNDIIKICAVSASLENHQHVNFHDC